MNYCSPHIKSNDHFTCFEDGELINIAKAFNNYSLKIKDNTRLIDVNKKYSKQQLWTEIYNRLNNLCKYEYCWIDLKFIDSIPDKSLRQKIKFFTFKPKMTIKQYTWLSTNDINYVLQQYEKLDENFKFIGALPSDFYKIIPSNMLNNIYKNILTYKRIGLIFNLDRHNQIGSHWVSLYIDNNIRTIEYFDSLGNKPNKYICKFIETINSKINKQFKIKYNILINKIVHQKENSECGVYSIYYIIQRLFGDSFKDLTNNIIRDKDMNKFRFNIFRPRI